MSEQSTYLVTVALPYANGPLHLGHLIEMLEADAWVRAKRLSGETCYFIAGDDAHGTPIMIKAEKEGCTPKQLVDRIHQNHAETIKKFSISFDKFSRTDTPANQKRCYALYERLKKTDLFFEQELEQAYDPEKEMFLPDRYVKGSCPHCGAADQYGDNCEKCGATYSPKDLKEPYSTLSGAMPVFKTRQHLFADLSKYQSWLSTYLPKVISASVMSKMQEWLEADLHPWNISRESPYHGIPIPDRPGQYFYVWFDAPIGYLSIFDELFEEKGFGSDFWKKDNLKLVHFIGKDIAYFHSIFWPVILKAADEIVPHHIFTHGFLTIEGQKMSKSKGLFLEASELEKALEPDLFRYYTLSKMNGSIDDFNFDITELCLKINSDIVGKYLNIISRCSKLLFDYFDGRLCQSQHDTPFVTQTAQIMGQAWEAINERQHGQAIQLLMRQVDLLNERLTQQAPWTVLKKEPQNRQTAWENLSEALYAFVILSRGLHPFLPSLTEKALSYFGLTITEDSLNINKLARPYEPLLHRLDAPTLKEKLFMTQQTQIAKEEPAQPSVAPIRDFIKIDDFGRLDLRIGTVKTAEIVPESNKLLRLQVDIGLKVIQVFSGIRGSYSPEELLGRQVLVCVNLEPRKMRFGLSEGMILAASDEAGLSVLTPLSQRENGAQVS